MADLLLCLDSGCGIDLTNTSGRLGASIRADSARSLKCDATTRQLYVGRRAATLATTPGTEAGCSNLLQIDGSGDLWASPLLSFLRRVNGADNMSVIGWPAASSSSGVRSTPTVWTNNTSCAQIIQWSWADVRAMAKAQGTLGAGEQMIAQYETVIYPVFSGGGVGAASVLDDHFIADYNAASFNAGSVLRRSKIVSGQALLPAGASMSFEARVDMGSRLNVDTTYNSDNGVIIEGLELTVHQAGYQRLSNSTT